MIAAYEDIDAGPFSFSYPYDHELCQALAELGHDVHLLARPLRANERERSAKYFRHEWFYRCSERLRDHQLLRWSYRYFKGLEHLSNMIQLLRKVKSEKPDVVHFQWTALPAIDKFFIKSLRKYCPVVLTVHNTEFMHGSQSSVLQRFSSDAVLGYFDSYIAHTEFTTKRLVQKGIKRPISVIPHGIFHLDKKPLKENVFKKPTILFFGHIKPYKGLTTLIKALALLPKDLMNEWQVCVAGSGEKSYIDNLKSHASELGVSKYFLWWDHYIQDDEVSRISQSAEIFVLPYKEIDASGAFASLLPFEKPIVASDVGVFSDTFKGHSKKFLFASESHQELATCLEKLISSPEERGAAKACTIEATEGFPSWRKIGEMTVASYAN